MKYTELLKLAALALSILSPVFSLTAGDFQKKNMFNSSHEMVEIESAAQVLSFSQGENADSKAGKPYALRYFLPNLGVNMHWQKYNGLTATAGIQGGYFPIAMPVRRTGSRSLSTVVRPEASGWEIGFKGFFGYSFQNISLAPGVSVRYRYWKSDDWTSLQPGSKTWRPVLEVLELNLPIRLGYLMELSKLVSLRFFAEYGLPLKAFSLGEAPGTTFHESLQAGFAVGFQI